jgi:multiple sugar transport system ATP-binding protein
MSREFPETHTAANITLKSVTKSFGKGAAALASMSLEIKNRELLVLLGPSGCGKSTLLNLLAGLEEPTEGRIYFGDKDVTSVPAERRHVSMVFQSIGLYPHMDALDNIRFPLKLKRIPMKEIDSRIRSIAEILGISYLLDRRLNELSGGERQRVAIAKALVKRPFLFLLDEAFSNLDAGRRRQMRTELVRVHQALDTTMVFVTHDQEEAMSIADRIAVMRSGRLIQIGSPLEVYERPVNVWVSEFIGNQPISIIDAVVDIASSQITMPGHANEPITVPAEAAQRWRDAELPGEVKMGVRPERVSLNESRGDIQVEVTFREVLGESILYHMTSQHGGTLRALLPASLSFAPGSTLWATIAWEKILIFDAHTETLIFSP